MIELEVYAAELCALNKILDLDHHLEAIADLCYKVDSNLFISSSMNRQSVSMKFTPFSLSLASIHVSSAPCRRNFGRNQKQNR